MYAAKDVGKAALDALQEIGFSFNPSNTPHEFQDCRLVELKHKNDDPKPITSFWTDFIPLTEDMVKRLGLRWQQLNISIDPNVEYRFQVVGCYYTDRDGSAVPFLNPKAAVEGRGT